MTNSVVFSINGELQSPQDSDLDSELIEYLHDDKNLTATKFCCGIGVCRACTVAVERSKNSPLEVMLACSTPVSELNGVNVLTVEGLAKNGELHPLQTAFLEHFSFQCGYCTSGFLMAGVAALDRIRGLNITTLTGTSLAAIDQILQEFIGPHICRCTGYTKYYSAFKALITEQLGISFSETNSEAHSPSYEA